MQFTTSLVSGLAFTGSGPAFAAAAARQAGDRPNLVRIAVIIDDIGFSRSRAHSFLPLEIPLTFSILPRVTYTRELAEALHAAGHEIMLHQPMEPVDRRSNPGPGALYTDYPRQAIVAEIDRNIAAIPHVTGVNNHMGSKFTADPAKMEQALGVVKSRALFFVDSLTTHRSAGYATANRLGITTVRRNIFLDNCLTIQSILLQLDRLQRRALQTGQAVAIGHPFPETVAALEIFNERIKKDSVQFVSISNLL
ncbi:MAG: hypothetical protein [Olavius algarvensis Delta 4 endosymbiont]|nr:MAG: hypothetical protein [Olavius algarvensis Delta 4 endosymbiont]